MQLSLGNKGTSLLFLKEISVAKCEPLHHPLRNNSIELAQFHETAREPWGRGVRDAIWLDLGALITL